MYHRVVKRKKTLLMKFLESEKNGKKIQNVQTKIDSEISFLYLGRILQKSLRRMLI